MLLHDVLKKRKDAQFIISTHSPVRLGCPKAKIISFDEGLLHEIEYEEMAAIQIVLRLLNDRERFLEELFNNPRNLIDEEAE